MHSHATSAFRLVKRYATAVLLATTLAVPPAHAQNGEADRSLFQAAAKGDLAGVQASLAAGADIQATNRAGLTATDLAVDRGHFKVAHFLLSVRNTANAGGAPAAAPRQTPPPGPPVTAVAPAPVQPTAQPPAPAEPPAPVLTGPSPFDPAQSVGTGLPGVSAPVRTPMAAPPSVTSPLSAADRPAPREVEAPRPVAPVAERRPASPPPPAPVRAAVAPPPPPTPDPAPAPAAPTALTETKAPVVEMREDAAPQPAAVSTQPAAAPSEQPSSDFLSRLARTLKSAASPDADPVVPAKPVSPPVTAKPRPTPVAKPAPKPMPNPAVKLAAASRPAAPAEPAVTKKPAAPPAQVAISFQPQPVPRAPRAVAQAETPESAPLPADPESLDTFFGRMASFFTSGDPRELAPDTAAGGGDTQSVAQQRTKTAPSATARALTQALRIGAEGRLGREAPPTEFGVRLPCVEKKRKSVLICVEDVTWPDDMRAHFTVESVLYRGFKIITRYNQGRAAFIHTLFPVSSFTAVVGYFTHLYGEPTETWTRTIAPLGEPRRPNPVMVWFGQDPATRKPVFLEVRQYDDARADFPDIRHGAVLLHYEDATPIFPLVSKIELMRIR